MNMKSRNLSYLTQAALIAALYVLLTYLANALGLANYAVQLRFSEALSILPCFTSAAIPGLFAGCLLSNLLTGCALPDILFGSLATLLGACGTYLFQRRRWCALLCPILANTLIIPLILIFGYGMQIEGISPLRCYGFYALTVGAGEILSCGVLGTLLMNMLSGYRHQLFDR